jgi:Ino eighty subunit 1
MPLSSFVERASSAGSDTAPPPSSPPAADESRIDDTQADDGWADTPEKPSRGKGKGAHAKDKDKDANGQQQIGKIRHLKKEDGEPLWREDIQYDFLKAVFDNEDKVFTNSYEPDRPERQNFADLYIDTMSRSTKTSKVLRDKLLSDREAAKGMAMVCLLVNMGRMNTTLNCKYLHHTSRNPIIIHKCLTWRSFPGDARAAANLPRDSVPTGAPGPACLQATPRRASTQVHP